MKNTSGYLGFVRAIAVCVFRHGDAVFVYEGHDRVKNQTFYRPLGGTIEFGEYSRDTVRREILEEIGEEIQNIYYLGTLENVFTYEGQTGHEIVIVYQADFVNPAVYTQESLTGHEDSGEPFTALWKDLAVFRNAQSPLYPDGLLALIDSKSQ